MPHYYAANLDIRLHISKSGVTTEDYTSCRGREWQKCIGSMPTILDRRSEALFEHDLPCLEGDSSLHFLGKDKNVPCRIVAVSCPEDNAGTYSILDNKDNLDQSSEEIASRPIEHDAALQCSRPDLSLEHALCDSTRKGVQFTQPSTDDSHDDAPTASNALIILVRLSPKCFDRSFIGKTTQDLKIDVFYNGELTHSRYIAGRDRSNPSKLIEFFSGRRVDRITEHAWTFESHERSLAKSKDARNGQQQSETSSTPNAAAGILDWMILCKKMIREADKYAIRPCGSRCPTADYLESLASMSKPYEFTQHGCMVTGVIDVCISLGSGKKFPPEAGYLVKPARLLEPKAQEGVTTKRTLALVSSPQVLTPSSFSNSQSVLGIKERQDYKSKTLENAEVVKSLRYGSPQVMIQQATAVGSSTPLEHIEEIGQITRKNELTNLPSDIAFTDPVVNSSSPDQRDLDCSDHVHNMKELSCDVDQIAIPSTDHACMMVSPWATLASGRNKIQKQSKVSSSSDSASQETGTKRRKIANDLGIISHSNMRAGQEFNLDSRNTVAAPSNLINEVTVATGAIRSGIVAPTPAISLAPVTVTSGEVTKANGEVDVVVRHEPKDSKEKNQKQQEQGAGRDSLEIKSAIGYRGYRPLKPGMSGSLSSTRYAR